MSILPDWQIRRDIKIEPFAEGAVRPGVISYGLSSYGYDVRVGTRFKLFNPYHEVKSMTNEAAAWIAGIIDGEGNLKNEENHDRGQQIALTVTNTDRAMLELLHSLTGVGHIYARKRESDRHKETYDWKVTRARHVQELLVRVMPYMVIKKAQAMAVIHRTFKRAGMPVVDPKNFDRDSFVDIDLSAEGSPDHAIIPPNSFALAETVEYFEIPRDILAICLGKSTYARCGTIVNITPLEPEWRGKITIEISNTTPLPARIYANEGIAQILFFRGEAVCATSYADKKGRYQDQKGLTLPFVTGTGPQPRAT